MKKKKKQKIFLNLALGSNEPCTWVRLGTQHLGSFGNPAPGFQGTLHLGSNEPRGACWVYNYVKDKVRDAVIKLIDKEREGEQVDRALLKNVLGIFVDIGMGQMEQYEKDFESSFLNDTGGYYSRKASIWILEDSCPDYMLKSEECLKKERERVSHYLHLSSEPKLVEKVQQELLVVFAGQLLEKEHSGCRELLRDDKVDDLSRMYRLYHKIPKGLEQVANVFKQHVTNEGTDLVQQAEDAASSQMKQTPGQDYCCNWSVPQPLKYIFDGAPSSVSTKRHAFSG
ncbi:hypothetical protein SLEP1_g17031 [Rubroshorea leprosula]|uniref:Cullin N-terminal domain-containing protein n=1 Tax=Rubroshorea leprosula TaxID=152421 RepID=A0AAV5IYF0_9ROSI|nr:hypothetical protein SLEP1_g17031 [Rubroshorea leprosula]